MKFFGTKVGGFYTVFRSIFGVSGDVHKYCTFFIEKTRRTSKKIKICHLCSGRIKLSQLVL